MCVCVCVCVCMYVCIYPYLPIDINIYGHIYVCVCIYVCIYAWLISACSIETRAETCAGEKNA